ncbi:hypothetical protein IQ255_16865 [Pleurocapsales cyanobacterium LEGE 10410]|nr:hypothetical protein [Pleurocapsales cyanobacterium LEGE 10410]
MTKSIQQIKQELENLESTVAQMAVELEKLHQDYLNLLSQSVKQQLILACYQICTQFYPQSFLDLSLTNKQELQQNLRQIGNEIEHDLLSIIEQKELEPEPRELNLMAELIKNLPKSKKKEDSEENSAEQIDLELVKAELANIEFIEIDASSPEDIEQESDSTESSKEKIDFKNPEHLILWRKQIERAIKKTLDLASRKTNKCLQKSAIIPARLPSKVIEVAMQAGSSPGAKSHQLKNVPNVLHLVIESDLDKKSKSSNKPEQISLLRLRLAELEFSTPLLNAKRGQIRNLMGKISRLNGKYKAIKHEAAIVEAQAAWRSSWYEN